jgi:transposase
VESGIPRTEVARRFSVSYAVVGAYVRRKRTTGSVAPARMHLGRNARVGRHQESALVEQLQAHPDATLAEHVGWWEASHGVRLSVSGMWRTIKRLGWTFKKRRWQPANKTSERVPPFESRSPS